MLYSSVSCHLSWQMRALLICFIATAWWVDGRWVMGVGCWWLAKEGCWVMVVRCWWLVKEGYWVMDVSCKVLSYRLTQCLCEMLCVLFICVNLWEKNTWDSQWGVFSFMLDISFSHREHGGHGGFKLTVSSPQKASGIQRSQRPHPQPLSEWRGE